MHFPSAFHYYCWDNLLLTTTCISTCLIHLNVSIVPEFICHPIIIIVVMQACLISNFHNLFLTQESCYSKGAVRGMSGTPVHVAAFL